jgi:hypothetical protein
VSVDTVQGRPGSTISFGVRFSGAGSGANAVATDLAVEQPSGLIGAGNRPACTRNVQINKEATGFAFRPPGCDPAVNCTQVRAGVISLVQENNATPLPDGEVFRCSFTIPQNAPIGGAFNVNVAGASAVFPSGTEQNVTGASQGGQIRVVDVPCIGDQNGNNEVASDEATRAVLAFANLDVNQNPAADSDRNGEVDSAEATRVVLNFSRLECNP